MTDTLEKTTAQLAGNGSRPQKTLALFGATGNTGRPFLPAVLRAGWAVRAFLRTPAKVDDMDGLEKVQGDLTDAAQIAEFVRGADAVACLAGVPRGAQKGGPLDGFMLQAIKDIVGGMKQHGVRRLLFQVGGFTILEGEPPTDCFVGCCVRDCVLGRCMGERVSLVENQRIANYLQGEKKDIDWTLPRPGMLKHMASKGTVVSVAGATETVAFADLVEWEVALLEDDSSIHQGPFPGYGPAPAASVDRQPLAVGEGSVNAM